MSKATDEALMATERAITEEARTASQRGRLSRTKGASFERRVCQLLRARLPNATIRRGKQSHLADEPDVVIAGGGEPWDHLWLELCDGRHPDARLKLLQAEDDCEDRGIPIAVTHKLGAKKIQATLRYCDLETLVQRLEQDLPSPEATLSAGELMMVTVDFAYLVECLPGGSDA